MIKVEKNVPMDVVFRDVNNLCDLHWEELANNKDTIKLAPDEAKYKALQSLGLLHNVVFYEDEKIVAYSIVLTDTHLHYKETVYAYVDVLFLHPDYRNGRLGIKLVDLTEEIAREAGASILTHHVKPHHQTLAKIIQKKGFKHAETIYAKLLEG